MIAVGSDGAVRQHGQVRDTHALADPAVDTANVALLDLRLGAESVNGIDLGIALREPLELNNLHGTRQRARSSRSC